jgi:hypothetical protein
LDGERRIAGSGFFRGPPDRVLREPSVAVRAMDSGIGNNTIVVLYGAKLN